MVLKETKGKKEKRVMRLLVKEKRFISRQVRKVTKEALVQRVCVDLLVIMGLLDSLVRAEKKEMWGHPECR